MSQLTTIVAGVQLRSLSKLNYVYFLYLGRRHKLLSKEVVNSLSLPKLPYSKSYVLAQVNGKEGILAMSNRAWVMPISNSCEIVELDSILDKYQFNKPLKIKLITRGKGFSEYDELD